MLDWLTDPNVMAVSDQIEKVNRKMFEKLRERNDNLAVFFYAEKDCKQCKIFQIYFPQFSPNVFSPISPIFPEFSFPHLFPFFPECIFPIFPPIFSRIYFPPIFSHFFPNLFSPISPNFFPPSSVSRI